MPPLRRFGGKAVQYEGGIPTAGVEQGTATRKRNSFPADNELTLTTDPRHDFGA
jgi:hypothetical protein